MSQRVTLDNGDMRSRLRASRTSVRTIGYQPRPQMRRASIPYTTVSTTHLPVYTDKSFTSTVAPVTLIALGKPGKQPKQIQGLQIRPLVSTLTVSPSLQKSLEQTKQHQPKRTRRITNISQAKLLMVMACFVFVCSLGASISGFRTSKIAAAQEATTNTVIDANSGSDEALKPTIAVPKEAPSTTPVTTKVASSYQVAPDLARYIKIPKIGVFARVLQVGIKTDGSLATPSGVFDAAWYTGSAKPGQTGATLIDGHVSSWTTNGVFYNIKKLIADDKIIIQKGDGTSLTYTVNKTVVYDVNSVDMAALMKTSLDGKSGLNLITCGGKYDSKSGEFTQRIGVFATLD